MISAKREKEWHAHKHMGTWLMWSVQNKLEAAYFCPFFYSSVLFWVNFLKSLCMEWSMLQFWFWWLHIFHQNRIVEDHFHQWLKQIMAFCFQSERLGERERNSAPHYQVCFCWINTGKYSMCFILCGLWTDFFFIFNHLAQAIASYCDWFFISFILASSLLWPTLSTSLHKTRSSS